MTESTTAERPNLSAACGAWEHGDGTNAHEHCTGRVALPAPRDVCECLRHRPTRLDYAHLTPGVEGYWPMIAAVPDDIAPGDRVSFAGDVEGHVVAEVRREGLRSWPCRIGYVTPAGELFTVGRMAGRIAGDPAFHLDRWGTHATLSTRGAR